MEVFDRFLEAMPKSVREMVRRRCICVGLTHSIAAARYSGWCFLKIASAVSTEVVHSG
jgi:hypothetical protein